MSEEIAVYEKEQNDLGVARPPEKVLAEAQTAAKALAEVIAKKKKPFILNGEQYLEFEDWQTVGRFYGITAKVVNTEYIEFGEAKGFQARAIAVKTVDGIEVSAAEAMCLNDENNWRHKPLFQLRSMAQTRACAKALRNVLAWVVVLAGYKATPAEEMPAEGGKKPVTSPQEKYNTMGDIIEAAITDITTKTGNTKGKPWTAYMIHTADNAYGTFDKKLAELAGNYNGTGEVVKITYEHTDKGKKLINIEPLEREPGSEG